MSGIDRRSTVVVMMPLLLSLGCNARHDFKDERTFDGGGRIASNYSTVTHTFKVQNSTKKTVKVLDVKKSCTCTKADLSKNELLPGEETTLTLSVSKPPTFLQWSVQCTLITDDDSEAEWTYTLSYRSYAPVRFDHDSIDLGEISSAVDSSRSNLNRSTAWLEFYSPVEEDGDSLESLNAPSPLHVEVVGKALVDTIESGRIRRTRLPIGIDLAGSIDNPSGRHAATVDAKTRLGYSASMVGTWLESTPISASPETIFFGKVTGAQGSTSRNVSITSTDGRPFRILAIEAEADRASVQAEAWDRENKPMHVVALNYSRRGSTQRFLSGAMILKTDHPAAPRVRVVWSAIND